MHVIRRIVALALAWALVVPPAAAQPKPNLPGKLDWESVRRLKTRTEVVVGLNTGQAIVGRFVAATDSTLQIEAAVPDVAGVFTPREVPRTSVRRVTRLGTRLGRRPASALGALAGLAGGLIAGGVYDATHRAGDDPDLGKLVFGMLGVLIGAAVGSVAFRHLGRDQVIYDVPCAGDCASAPVPAAS